MNGAATLVQRTVTLLRNAGLTAFAEFDRGGLPLPDARCYTTVGAVKTELAAVIPLTERDAVPLIAELRVRLHAPAGQDTGALNALREKALAALAASGDPPVTLLYETGCSYQKQTDRLSADLHVQIAALLMLDREEEPDDT
ncbi:MAG: hypothetical protein IKQ39_02900 [Oscillospiraceae bacterium]|nr:hypothetical protein [Oscillospiraceae bacterium]